MAPTVPLASACFFFFSTAMARPMSATSNPPLHSRLHLCQRPSPPAPPHSISYLPLQKPLPDSWKLLLAGFACGSSHSSSKWRFSTNVSFFTGFVKKKGEDVEELKQELYKAIAALDRGADATPEDRQRVDQITSKLEAVNKVKEPLKSELLNGKWELLYTTSQTLLQTQRPKFLRPNGKIFQAINVDTLRAQNMETWPFYNQATANLVPLNAKRVAVKFDFFRIAGLIPIKNPGSGRGQLEITYLDDELRLLCEYGKLSHGTANPPTRGVFLMDKKRFVQVSGILNSMMTSKPKFAYGDRHPTVPWGNT